MDARHTKVQIPNPRANANPFSAITFWWLFGLFRKGFKKELEEDDLYEALDEHKSAYLGDKLEKVWKLEVDSARSRNKEPSLLKVIAKCFGPGLMGYSFIVVVNDACTLMTQPLLLGGLIQYFLPDSHMDTQTAYLYATGIVLCSTVNMVVKQSYMMAVFHIGMKMRVGLCSLLYRKALRLSKTALRETTVGQAVNLLSNDVSRFDRSVLFFVYLWFGPIQTIIIAYFVWLEIGIGSFLGIAVILLVIPVQAFLGKWNSKLRLSTAKRTDERIRLMNEIIMAIQVIKMYAWEKPFAKLVHIARKREIRVIKKMLYIRGFLLSSEKFTTKISVFIAVVIYVLLGNHITAVKMFVVTAYFNVLKITMTDLFPIGVAELSQTLVSVKRIKTFLLHEEISSSSSEDKDIEFYGNGKKMDDMGIPDNGTLKLRNVSAESDIKVNSTVDETSINIANISAKWTEDLNENTLRNVTLKVSSGSLVAVIGTVGAVKSSLLHAVLRELPIISGTILVRGTMSYASQEPWLFSASVRQNILFGQPFNSKRYKAVVRVCALERDFELFPYGDKTIVGERGVTLSGGQKARINLARAVYREADVYLLDDPLSAVDAHVGRHLFDDCICDFLKGKTRVLITHQLQYLHTADNIVILNNGKIEATGTFSELQGSGLDFAKQLQAEDNEVINIHEAEKHQLDRRASVNSEQESLAGTEPKPMAEMRTGGSIGAGAYRAYWSAGGSCGQILFMLGLCVLAQVAISGGDYWMSYWTKVEEQHMDLKEHDMKWNESDINWMEFGSNHTKNEGNVWLPDTVTSIYIYTGIMVAIIILTLFSSMSFFRTCMSASKNLHRAMFDSISHGSMWFFNSNPSGQILNRFSKDMGAIDEMLPQSMIDFFQRGLALFGISTVVAIVNVWMLIPTAIMLLAFYLLRLYYVATSRSIKRLEAITRSPVFSHLSASLQGLTTIRAFQAQASLEKEFDNYQDLHSSSWYLFVAANRAFGFWLDTVCLGYIAFVTLSFLVLGGEHFGGDVGLAITQAVGLTGMLQWAIRQSAEMENQMTSVERVLEYHTVEKEPFLESTSDQKPPKKWPAKGEIEFDRVFLAYSKEESPVLKNICLTITSAEKVGIVGRTGAGKSSIISALFRLVNLSGGFIRIDGRDTASIGLHDLRSKMSIIPQEPALFSGMLRANLDPFEQYSDAVLWSALDDVELKKAVEELPSGLSHKVSEGGSNFSVGQRQLLCLARAIIRSNKILVLDEATANVDPKTDELIQTTIRRKFADCTVLTIAHRLHTVIDSDRIIVMDAGTVVEFDHPYLLLQNHNSYLYKLVQETGHAVADSLFKLSQTKYESMAKKS